MNGHADVTALLNADTGNTVATYYYDAFGTITEETNGILPEGEKVNNPFRYSGYQYDEETVLYYLNARMYDSKIARFLQEDTYRGTKNDPLSLNLYAYCRNNPLIYWDPTGHAGEYIQKGDKGKDVKSIQQMLIKDGYSVGACGADGVFGKATETALRAYQKDHGLKVDGIVGNQTLTSLTSGEKAPVGKITIPVPAPKQTTPTATKKETPKSTVKPTPPTPTPKPTKPVATPAPTPPPSKPQTNKPTNSGEERRRYQTEEKYRDLRNKQKRQGKYNKIDTNPEPCPAPLPPSNTDSFIENNLDSITTEDVIIAGGTIAGRYILYRIIRVLPSFLPPFLWTLPANIACP